MTQMKLAQFRKHLAGLNSQHRKKIKGSADIESAEPFLLPTQKQRGHVFTIEKSIGVVPRALGEEH
jgi:hypothetical protein